MAFRDSAEMEQFMREALAQAPSHIQEFLRSGKYDTFIESVRSDTTLHVDATGRIYDEVLMMILGMTEPAELVENLKSQAGLTDEQAGAVVEKANNQIFIPIQEEMRRVSEKRTPPTQASSAPKAPVVPPPSLVTPVAAQPVPPAPQPSVNRLQAPEPIAAPTAPALPVPEIPTPTLPAPVMPPARTMAHDIEAMQSGGAPAAPAAYVAPAPAIVAPLPPAPRAPEPAPLPSQWAAPVAPPSDVPSFAKVPAAPVPKTPAPSLQEVTSTLQKYGIDPYREAVE